MMKDTEFLHLLRFREVAMLRRLRRRRGRGRPGRAVKNPGAGRMTLEDWEGAEKQGLPVPANGLKLDGGDQERPTIQVNGRHMREITDDAVGALKVANHKTQVCLPAGIPWCAYEPGTPGLLPKPWYRLRCAGFWTGRRTSLNSPRMVILQPVPPET